MSVARNTVFPKRVQDEATDRQRLEALIDAKLQKNTGDQSEPKFVAIEFDRMSPEGVDRYTDHVLGTLLEAYKQSGWQEVEPSLEDGNKKIKLWFK